MLGEELPASKKNIVKHAQRSNCSEFEHEAQRLYASLKSLGWKMNICREIAPFTYEINALKKQKNAVILAHSYQTPDIIYGIADYVGDSYGLSKEAQKTNADTIIFAGVRFMAETAKILNPSKTVLLPAIDAGCSLSESITVKDIIRLKKQYPEAPVVGYVNTSADVKAVSDACCTSANVVKILKALPGDKVIFIPDNFMAENVAGLTKKKVIGWNGKCVVHIEFTPEKALAYKKSHPEIKILAHSECSPELVAIADYVGGTEDMVRYIKHNDGKKFMLVTECGLSDRMKIELPKKEFIGMCVLCPYMKRNNLHNILAVLKKPTKEQTIEVPEDVRAGAEKALQMMFKLSE